jgi:hypothetical protein
MRLQIDHEEHHAQLEQWCNEASKLLQLMVERLDAIEERLDDHNARISEWESAPR